MAIIDIGIIGGSISGCIIARALQLVTKHAIKLTIYERASANLESRGAGIMLPVPLINKLNDQLGLPLTHYPVQERIFVYKDPTTHAIRELWRQPIAASALHWGALYKSLRKDLDPIYHLSHNVLDILHQQQKPKIILDNGVEETHDFIICADGYSSLGRRLLFPSYETAYAGYIVWRGVCPINNIETMHELPRMLCYEKGHALCYVIPGKKGPELNWVIYEPYSLQDLQSLQLAAKPSLPLPEAKRQYLIAFCSQYFPTNFADMVKITPNPFYQIVNDAIAPSFFKDNIALVGDAAKVLRPHVGSGAAEAIRQAFALSALLEENENPLDAFNLWNQTEIEQGAKLMNLSRSMGRSLVTNTPDWSQMDPSNMEQWWDAVISGQPWYITDDVNHL